MSYKIKKLKITESEAENIQPQYGYPQSSCANCSKMQTTLDEVKDELVKMQQKFERMEQTQINRDKAIMLALAEQKVVTQKLIRQESVGAPIAEFFPIQSEEDLKNIEDKIMTENREIYVSTIKRMLQQNATRNLKNILSDEIVLSHNIDGTHGKKRIKSYEKFYAALLDSISQLPKVEDAEDHLRKAIRLQKKRNFKSICLAKTATPT